jgi:hypothetical protein
MKRSQTDLYVFKLLPPDVLIKVRNYAIKLLLEDNIKQLNKEEVENDKKRS